jgi:ELWxxDGT repeat protein
MKATKWLVLASLIGVSPTVIGASGPRPVANLPWVAETEAGYLGSLVSLGDRVLFPAGDFQHKGALWVTDGTLPGTHLLSDPCAGAFAEYRGLADDAVTTGQLTYPLFWQRCGAAGEWHLWRTDGTGLGTRRVENLPPLKVLQYLGRADDESYLWVETAGERSHWRLEAGGSAAHRVLATDFDPEFCRATVATTNACDLGPRGIPSPGHGSVTFPGVALYVLLISDLPRPQRTELWASDGTAGGTERLLVLTVGPGSKVRFVKAGSLAYFFSGDTLWTTDGTVAGTRAVRPFLPPASMAYLDSLQSEGEQALFYASENGQTSLWISRGSLQSTRPVLLPCSESCSFHPLNAWFAVTDLGVLAWAEEAGETAIYLLESSEEIRKLLTVPQAPGFGDLRVFGSAAGRIWFSVDYQRHQLYASDGTAAGTRPVGAPGGLIYQVAEVAPDRIVLTREGDSYPEHSLLETATATGATRQVLLDWNPFALDQTVQPRDLFAARSKLFFLAGRHPAEGGEELYRTDGTPSGLRPLTQGRADLQLVQPRPGTLVYTACGEVVVTPGPREECRGDTELYSLTADEEVVTPLSPGVNFYEDSMLAAHGEAIVHRRTDGLFATDLDANGLKVLSEAADFSPNDEPPIVTPNFFFTGTLGVRRLANGQLGEGFDLPLPGTLRGSLGDRPAYARFLTDSNEVGLFLGTIGDDDRLAEEIEIFRGDEQSRWVSTAVGTFFFTAKSVPSQATKWRLWQTDGSAEGTTEVAPELSWVAVGPERVPFGPLLLFSADLGDSGLEPWVTDGTAAGTRRLADLWPGPSDSRPSGFRLVDGRVYFAANDGVHGNELWVTDGSSLGTRRLTDLHPGPASSNPREFTPLGDEVFFSASNGRAGAQIWAIRRDFLGDPDPPGGPWLTSDEASGFRFKVRFAGGVAGQAEPTCLPETLCVSGAVPGRAEVFLRVVGPRPNGFLWPTLVKFSTASVEVWIEQQFSGVRRYYQLSGARPDFDELPGLFDREAFRPASASPETTAVQAVVTGEPPSGEWLTSAEIPGFRFKVEIAGRLGQKEAACLAETLCVSGAVPGRSEVFVRVVGPKPNGFLWPTIVRFTTSQARVWVEQITSGVVQEYVLQGAGPGLDELSGLFDRTGFRP